MSKFHDGILYAGNDDDQESGCLYTHDDDDDDGCWAICRTCNAIGPLGSLTIMSIEGISKKAPRGRRPMISSYFRAFFQYREREDESDWNYSKTSNTINAQGSSYSS
jgi:hypothetical protein